MRFRQRLIVAALSGWFCAECVAQPAESPSPRYEFRDEHDPNGIGKFYMGREIAHVMGHLGADWLERPERETEEAPRKMINALKISKGDVVADIGAGTGYFSFRLARRVGPTAGCWRSTFSRRCSNS